MMQQQFERDSAAVVMVEALYIAATQNKEAAIADYLSAQLAAGTLSLSRLRRHFQLLRDQQVPTVTVQQHQLDDYDQLLIPDTTTAQDSGSTCLTDVPANVKPLPNAQNPSQDSPVISYARSVGIPRTPSPTAPNGPTLSSCWNFCQLEVDQRWCRRLERAKKDATLPTAKTVSNFDFDHLPHFNPAPLMQLTTDIRWLKQAQNCLISALRRGKDPSCSGCCLCHH